MLKNIKRISLCLLVLCLFIFNKNKSRLVKSSSYINYNSQVTLKDRLLKINKINLSVLIKENDTLDIGLEIHPISYKNNMPLVIMGHSGVGRNVYFNDLDLLKIGDTVEFFENNIKNEYEIINLNYFSKGNKLKLPRSDEYLFLVTCDRYNLRKQLIISAKKAKNHIF